MILSISGAVIAGLMSGYLSGQLGVGGGLMTTPAIRLLLGYSAPIAVGTPLAVMIPTSLIGAGAYARHGFVDRSLASRVAVTGLAGALAGSYLTKWISGSAIMIATAVVLAILAVRMAVHGRHEAEPDGSEPEVGPLAAYGLGLGAGLFSGLLGLGGGVIMIPVFVRTFGRPIKTALGTSLAVIALLAVPGSVVHYALGHVDLKLALLLATGMVPGVLLGSRLAIRAPEHVLRLAFAGFLAVLAVALGTNEIVRML